MFDLVVALLVGSSTTCGPLDLEATRALAVARSDEVAIKRAELLAADADRALASAARWLPSASATFTTGPAPEARGTILESDNTNRSLAGLGPFVRVDVTAVQPLWTWGQLDAARNAAEAGVAARTALVRDATRTIEQRVRQLYFTISLTNRLLKIAGEVESALDQVDEKIAESLAKGDGEIKQEDKFRVAIFRSDVALKRADGEKALSLARAGIAAMLAIDVARLQLAEEPLPPVSGDVPELDVVIARALELRPDLAALDQALVAKRAQADAVRAATLPQLFLAGQLTYSRAWNRDIQDNPWIGDPFNTFSVGAVIGLRQNLAIPMMLAQVDKTDAELATLTRQREGLARLVRFEVAQAHAELVAAAKKAKATKASLTAGKGWFRSAQLDFGMNVTDARSLLDAYAGYVKTQLDSAQASYEFLVARGRLDQVTGQVAPEGVPCALQ
ncbi:TolC family protein [Myxococcota bacterium]|nr:TolC family protein [Myxococcota bacterium]